MKTFDKITSRPKIIIFSLLLVGALALTIYHGATILQSTEKIDGWGFIAATAIDIFIAATAYVAFDTSLDVFYNVFGGLVAIAFVLLSDGLNTSYYLHHPSNLFTLWELDGHITSYIVGGVFPVAAASIGVLLAGILESYRIADKAITIAGPSRVSDIAQGTSIAVANINARLERIEQQPVEYAQFVERLPVLMQKPVKPVVYFPADGDSQPMQEETAQELADRIVASATMQDASPVSNEITSVQVATQEKSLKQEKAKELKASGLSNQQIAEQLGVNIRTIQNYMKG